MMWTYRQAPLEKVEKSIEFGKREDLSASGACCLKKLGGFCSARGLFELFQ